MVSENDSSYTFRVDWNYDLSDGILSLPYPEMWEIEAWQSGIPT